jgi:hypothetical protein
MHGSARRALPIVLARCRSFICTADLCSRYSVRGNKVNVATPPDVLNITELLNRVDNDRELVSELFLYLNPCFPLISSV